MGDRTNVIYEIGGALSASELEQLATILFDRGAWSVDEDERDFHPSAWINGALAENGALSAELCEVNYATDETLEGFLKLTGAHWSKRWGPGGTYGAGREEHDPTLHKPIELDCDHDGDAVLKLEAILVLISDPLVDTRTWLTRWASPSARQIPPLSLRDEPAMAPIA